MIRSISFVITDKCNLNCSYCWYSSGSLPKTKNELSCDSIIKFLESIKGKNKLESIQLSGGEAMLHTEFETIVESLKEYTNEIVVMTNGVLLDEKMISFLKEHKVELHISLDSIDSDYHEIHRGNQAETIDGVIRLNKLGYDRKSICMTISTDNIDEISKVLEFADMNKCSFNCHLLDVKKDNSLSWKNATSNEVDTLIQSLEMSNSKIGSCFSTKIKMFRYLLANSSYKIPRCYNSEHGIVIDTDGEIYPCFNNKDLSFGNIDDIESVRLFEDRHRVYLENVDRPLKCFDFNCGHLAIP